VNAVAAVSAIAHCPKLPKYGLVRKAVRTLTEKGETLCYTSQNLAEFWNVCTRPRLNNGLGLTPAETDARATVIESRFRLLPDNERVHREWRRLVVALSVAGVQVHDARLVAAMLVHGVSRLLTLNDRDFASRASLHPPCLASELKGVRFSCHPRWSEQLKTGAE
jgi:predicted nucleic acid-binding protein